MNSYFKNVPQLLAEGRPNNWPVALCNDVTIRWHEFVNLISTYASNLPRHPNTLVLSEGHPLKFLALMLAALSSSCRIVIPPNFQPQTLAKLKTLPPVNAPREPTLELYTSGTTGQPKLVTKTLRQLEAECHVLQEKWGAPIGQRTVIATIPHHHIYGLLFRLLWPLCAGRPFDCTTISEPRTLQERLTAAGVTILVSSPAQLSRLPALLSLQTLSPRPIMIFSSGGPLHQEIAQHYIDAWGASPIEIFGSTETGGIAWRQQKIGDNAWTPLPTVHVDRADDEALIVTSPFLPDANPIRMEDRASLGDDGRFKLLGRIDRTIKIEEKRLSLPEMEECLVQHPAVAAAALAPMSLKDRQFIGAIVVLNGNQEVPRRTMVEHLRTHLGERFDRVLLPRRWRFVECLPFNERGKLALPDILAILENAP